MYLVEQRNKLNLSMRKVAEMANLDFHHYCRIETGQIKSGCLKEGKLTPMEEVHHILPVNRGGSNDWSNLMSLCHSCHEKIHKALGDR